jgi:hypothetical protein
VNHRIVVVVHSIGAACGQLLATGEHDLGIVLPGQHQCISLQGQYSAC